MESFVNLYVNTLSAACGSGDATISVATPGPLPSGSGLSFRVLIDSEIMIGTARTGSAVTVTRGAEGTTAVAHSSGATVTNILTAGALEQLEEDVETQITGAIEDGDIIPAFVGFSTVNIDCSAGGTVIYDGEDNPYPSQVVLTGSPGANFILQFTTGEFNVLLYNETDFDCRIQTDTSSPSGTVLSQESVIVVCSGNSGSGAVSVLSSNVISQGNSFFIPQSEAPATFNRTIAAIFTSQTTSSDQTTGGTLPLPGTSGSFIPSLSSPALFSIDMLVRMQSTTTLDSAWFKLSWAWTVAAEGSPQALGTLTSVSVGNSVATPQSPPVGWNATLSLDGPEENVLITVTGDTVLTVDVSIQVELNNLQ